MTRSSWFRFAPLNSLGSCDDLNAAPGAYKGDHPAEPWTLRRGAQNMVWIYAFGLVFLLLAFISVGDDHPSRAVLAGRIALILVIGFCYLLTAWVCDTPLWVRWCYLGFFLGLLAMTATIWGWNFVNYGVYLSIMLATLIPWRTARWTIVAWNVAVAASTLLNSDLTPIYIALIGLAIGLATGGGMEAGRIGSRLSRAEQRVSTLAVAAERERIGRDLHDILGHSLTAISIKSGLARKLLETDPEAAGRQMAEVEEVARQALADVRATASAIREVRVATEVAGARSILLAGGIEARLPTAIERLPDERSELFGYVIREAVTNVVRHSEATTCSITVTPDGVTVSDDGKGMSRTAQNRGTGLTGLRKRVEAAGGTLLCGPNPGGGTLLEVSMTTRHVPEPAAAPVEVATR
jgi:two-component system sensor histidine kinase DesK